jgi:hypothetical protein
MLDAILALKAEASAKRNEPEPEDAPQAMDTNETAD